MSGPAALFRPTRPGEIDATAQPMKAKASALYPVALASAKSDGGARTARHAPAIERDDPHDQRGDEEDPEGRGEEQPVFLLVGEGRGGERSSETADMVVPLGSRAEQRAAIMRRGLRLDGSAWPRHGSRSRCVEPAVRASRSIRSRVRLAAEMRVRKGSISRWRSSAAWAAGVPDAAGRPPLAGAPGSRRSCRDRCRAAGC